MPWRGPEVPGEFPTLGYLVGEWIEANCVIPDGDYVGEPYRLTEPMWRFLLWFYRLDPDRCRFTYTRGGQLVKPQKWGKGPFGSAIICAEAEGPTIPDGWDAAGEPVGRPWSTPWIQVTATAEDQTDNVWRSLQPMIELSPDLNADIPDTGKTRINLAGGGLIEPVTAKAGTRLGQRVTFVLQDETHGWLPNTGGRALADTQRRNVAGMGGRWLETTNAWDPNQSSVAQDTAEEAAEDVYRDHVQPAPTLKLTVQRDRRKILKQGYDGCWWVDRDRIEAEVVSLLDRDPGQAERYFGNRIWSGDAVWMAEEPWKNRAAPNVIVGDKEQITVGFDGSLGTVRSRRKPDATALGGCRVGDGHLFTLGIWEADRADGDGLWTWEPPRDEIDRVIGETFDRYDVVLMWADPQHWQNDVGRWALAHGSMRVLERWTNNDDWMARELERLHTAVINEDVTHDGNVQATRHVLNAQRHVKRSSGSDPDGKKERVLVSKKHRNSPDKIDMVPTWVLAYAARAHVLDKGLHVKPEPVSSALITHRARAR